MTEPKVGDVVTLCDGLKSAIPGTVDKQGYPENYATDFILRNSGHCWLLLDVILAPFWLVINRFSADNRIAILLLSNGMLCWVLFSVLRKC